MVYKKKKHLRPKYIKRKTGAKAQSKQIMALSRQVSKLTKHTTTAFNTAWERQSLPIDTFTQTGRAWVCPIPALPCNPYNSGDTGTSRLFSDNLVIASQPSYTKETIFTNPNSIKGCSKIYCNGGTIKWQMSSKEPAYSKITLALIRPKKITADQVTRNRGLKDNTTGAAPGSAARLYPNLDYTVHTGNGDGEPSTFFGCLWNKRIWDVLYSREVAFSSPKNPDGLTSVTAPQLNSSPMNNGQIATGTIRLPKYGMCMNKALRSDGDATQAINAIETGFLDSRNERECYLVAVNNGASGDSGETINLAFRVLNYYTAVN